jgi:hypothetical protein
VGRKNWLFRGSDTGGKNGFRFFGGHIALAEFF